MPSKNLPALNDLAKRINEEHEACQVAMRSAVEHAVRAGELLIEAKAGLAHGQWLPWLEGHCGVSERTAQAYMRLARELPKLEPEDAQRVADLPLREALKELAEPTDVIDKVIPFDHLVRIAPEPDDMMTLCNVFDHLGLLLSAYEGNIEVLPPARLQDMHTARNRLACYGDWNIRCERKMGLYLKELERRDYHAPISFEKIWPGPVPWLDFQVIEVRVPRKGRVQLKAEDNLLPISELLREELQKPQPFWETASSEGSVPNAR